MHPSRFLYAHAIVILNRYRRLQTTPATHSHPIHPPILSDTRAHTAAGKRYDPDDTIEDESEVHTRATMLPARLKWLQVRHRLTQTGGRMQANQWMRTHPLIVDSLLAVAIAIPLAGWSLAIILDAAHLPWSFALGLAVITQHASPASCLESRGGISSPPLGIAESGRHSARPSCLLCSERRYSILK